MTDLMTRSRSTEEQPPGQRGSKGSGRLDIQGLRAFAVLVVIIDHVFEWPGGGYVGVDVFFVISGFLITGILLREHERTGHISWASFYRKRFRRIIPAAALTLVVTLAVAKFVFYEDRWRETVTDSAFALLFSANWRFQSLSTDYFEQGGPVSPFQHYWSLSVEEQFYFVWPWLLLMALVILRRRSARTRRILALCLITTISALSFAWALRQTADAPAEAYFSTFTRVWELGVGAMLAVAAPVVARTIPNVVRPALSWAGLAGMVASLWLLGPESSVPAPGMLLPVLSAVLFVAAGTRDDGQQQPFLWPLTNPVSTFLGDISYSLYLWHFPCLVLLLALFGDRGPLLYLTTILATLVTATAAYHVVEDPLRKSPLLEPSRSKRRRREAWARWWDKYAVRMKSGGMALLAGTTLAFTIMSLIPPPPPAPSATSSYDIPVDTETPLDPAGEGDAGEPKTVGEQALAADIESALSATSWPKLAPSLDTLEDDAMPTENSDGCGEVDLSDPSMCAYGDPGDPTIAVLGDSTAVTLLPTVRKAFGNDHYVRGLMMAGCVLPIETARGEKDFDDRCREHRAEVIDVVREMKPRMVFIIDTYSVEPVTDLTGSALQTAWTNGMQAIVDDIGEAAEKIVVVAPAPASVPLAECATRLSSPEDCVYSPSQWHQDLRQAERQVTGSNVTYLDTMPWFCSADERCPAFVGTTPLKRDNVHPTRQWAVKIAPFLEASVA